MARIGARHGNDLRNLFRDAGNAELGDIRRGVVHAGAEPVAFPGEPLDVLVQERCAPAAPASSSAIYTWEDHTVGVGYRMTISSWICAHVSGS